MALVPAIYPRTFRVAAGWRVLSTTLGLVIGLGGLVIMWEIITNQSATPFWKAVMALVDVAGLGGWAYYLIVAAQRDRIVLTHEGVTVYQLLGGTFSLRYDEIAGRRELPGARGITNTWLVPNQPDRESIRINAGYTTDPVYDEWLASIPNLGSDLPRES